MLGMIREAHSLLIVDLFLWNDWQGPSPERQRALADELVDALIARQRQQPTLNILVLTDPINRVYADQTCAPLRRLADAGIAVTFTDLDRLRDPNSAFSRLVRFYAPLARWCPPLRRRLERPALANPLIRGGPCISWRQLLTLMHFKANHRKVVIADTADGGWHLLVGSFNPADGSSAHHNLAVRIGGELPLRAAAAEIEALAWSAQRPAAVIGSDSATVRQRIDEARRQVAAALARLAAVAPERPLADDAATADWLTEGRIRERILHLLGEATADDDIRIALFYLSDREVVAAIGDAARRGATVRLILDANRDAFGRAKNGIPNRPVAAELLRATATAPHPIALRWATTAGEQFHGKAMSRVNRRDGATHLLLGSANWTRRNLQDFNMEADIHLRNAGACTARFNALFDAWWADAPGGNAGTLPPARYLEGGWRGRLKRLLYRVQESTGLCSF